MKRKWKRATGLVASVWVWLPVVASELGEKDRGSLKYLWCDLLASVTAKIELRRKGCWLGKRLEGSKRNETMTSKHCHTCVMLAP